MIYLQRHTKPHVNTGICYGQTDVALHPETKEQEIAAVLKNLEPLMFSKVYTSPLQRCRLLAEAICLHKGLNPPTVDARLMEMSFGEWELRRWEEIFLLPEGKEWFADYLVTATPQGESFLQVIERAKEFLSQVNQNESTLLVTHDGFIRAALVNAGQLNMKHAFDERYPYGVLKEMSYTKK